jgi:betaine-aldehyde dehydrogenase
MRNALFIDGQWVLPVRGGTFPVIDPATAQTIHLAPAGTAEDIDSAVEAAREAFDRGPWARMSGAERGKYLRLMANALLARKGELARLEVLDNGKPLPEADWDVADAAGCFEFYAELAEEFDSISSREIVLPDERFTARAVREPLGVVGAIVPWNYPLLMAAWKIAPALAAGCTVVLKPSELTSLTALELASIAAEVGLPRGVLNVVTGLGEEAGHALSHHLRVDKVAFTGSVPTGRKVMVAAARDIKKISLELGGKSPLIVFDDVDVEKAVEWILFGIFWNQGQVCSATSRVLIQDGLYERLLSRLVAETNRIRIGPGLAAGTLLGPLISARQLDRVLAAVKTAQDEGATVVAGGTVVDELAPGYFVRPTILIDVPTASEAWREEIFGPVVSIRRFNEEAEAVRLANDSRFGLAAAVMSEDAQRADRVAAALRAGIVWINCSQPTFTQAPWGGYKQSGIGRELGRWGFESYLETKQITRYCSDQPWGWYLK